MKHTNSYLSIGLIILIFFVTIMTFPSLFTETSPYEITGVESYNTADGNYAFRTPPFEPSDRFVFGSDDSGRDVFSFVIYGARLTLTIGVSVALLRFIIGLFLGIRAALGKPLSILLVNQFNNVFNAIPPLIICLIILSIGYLGALPKAYSIGVFVLVMTLVEWARVADFIRERAENILEKDFVRSERIIGKGDAAIVFENLLPHMFSELIVLFFMEISRVLTLMMQLGIFGIFIGNLKIVEDTAPGMVIGKMTSYEPEWASMLGSSKNYIRVAPWIVMSCSLMFFLAVLGFNFVGEGLRMLYQEGNRLFKSKRQQIMVLVVLFVLVITAFSLTYQPSVALMDPEEGFSDLPEVALVGMASTHNIANEIVKRFEDLGLEKTKERYLYPYFVPTYYYVTSMEVTIETSGHLMRLENVGLLSYKNFSGKGKVVDLRGTDLIGSDYVTEPFREAVKDAFVLIEGDFFDDVGKVFFSQRLLKETQALGVIVPVENVSDKEVGLVALDRPVITVPKDMVDSLVGGELSIEITACEYGGEGQNIVGQIKSPNSSDDTKGVLIGFDYNYLTSSCGKEQLNTAFELIETIVANQERLKRNVTIVFWDGAYDASLSGFNSYYKEYYYPIKHSLAYIDMTGLYKQEGQQSLISYNSDYITLSKPDAYSMVTFMIDALGRQAYEVASLKENYSVFYHKRGIQTLYLGTNGCIKNDEVIKRLKEVLVETLVKEMY